MFLLHFYSNLCEQPFLNYRGFIQIGKNKVVGEFFSLWNW